MTASELTKIKEESASVAYQSFVLLSRAYKDSLFCFLEGKDAPYYHPRVKPLYSGNIHYIKSGGKRKVLKVKQLIEAHSEYTKYKKAYFIDVDFDESLIGTSSFLYETSSYSIENFYCTSKSMSEILKCEFGINEHEPEFMKIMQLYEYLLNNFLSAILLFNAWYLLQKRKSKQLNVPNNVNLSENLPKGFVTITLDGVDSNYDLNAIKSEFPNSLEVTDLEIQKAIEELKKYELVSKLRGKYIFNFLISFIRLLIMDANIKSNRKYLTNKVKLNIDSNSALSHLTAYAITPPELSSFISQYS